MKYIPVPDNSHNKGQVELRNFRINILGQLPFFQKHLPEATFRNKTALLISVQTSMSRNNQMDITLFNF